MGHRGDEGDGPAEDADDGGPLDVGEGEDVERGADGEVALQGEREDRQHWGVRGAAQYDDDIKQQTFKLNMYLRTLRTEKIELDKSFPRKDTGTDANKLKAHSGPLKYGNFIW